MAETEPIVPPFVVPRRDDDLLQCSNTIYYVKELIQDEEEIREAVNAFGDGVRQGDFERIVEHFDHFFALVRSPSSSAPNDVATAAVPFDAQLRTELAELLIDSLENLRLTLQMHICDINAVATAAASSANTTATMVGQEEAVTANNDGQLRQNADERNGRTTALNRRYSNCLLMHVYLLSSLTNHFEQHLNKRTRSAVATATPGGTRGKRKVMRFDNSEDDPIVQFWDVQDRRYKLIKALYNLISMSVTAEDNDAAVGDEPPRTQSSALRCLWTNRQSEDNLKICILSIVCKFLENPEVCKAGGRTNMFNVFTLLRLICICWDMNKAVAIALIDLAPRLDYFQSAQQATTFPFVEAIKSVQTDNEMEPLLREMIAYGSKLDTAVVAAAESSSSTSGAGAGTSGGGGGGGTGGRAATETATRAFALFISATVELNPRLMQRNLAFIMPFLKSDPPMLRNSVLFVFTEILLHCFDCQQLDQTMSDQRDMLFAHLLDHMVDKSALVRARVLHLWAKLASKKGAIPPVQFRLGLLWEARGRLNDDSVSVRKAAATLLTTLVRYNRFGADLNSKTFFAQFLPVRRRLFALYRPVMMPMGAVDGAAAAGGDGAGGTYAFEDAYVAVGDERLLIEEDRADMAEAQRDRVKTELDYQLDVLLFTTQMEKTLKHVLEYMRQAQKLELGELLRFVCECVKFRLRDSMHALKRTFSLIWRKDTEVVDQVTEMAYEALFSKNENTRIAHQRTAQNLVEAMRRATAEERVSLEEAVTRVFAKYPIHRTVFDEFWTYLDSADPELRLGAARLIVVVANADHRLLLPHLDRLYELYRLRPEQIRVEILRVLTALAMATQRKYGCAAAAPTASPVTDPGQQLFRLEPKDKFVKLMSTIVFNELDKLDVQMWVPHCRHVVNIIYSACLRPNRVINDLYDSIIDKTKQCLYQLRQCQSQTQTNDLGDDEDGTQSCADGIIGSDDSEHTLQQPQHDQQPPEEEQLDTQTVEQRRAVLELVVSRLLFFVGEVVLKFLSYAECTFSVHIKDTILRRGLNTPNPKRPQSRHSELNFENTNKNNDGDEDGNDDELCQEISEEEKNQMCLQQVLDKSTFANDTIIGRTMPVLMAVLQHHTKWSNVAVEAALLCLAKFMLVNVRCCKTFLPAFFSFYDAASVRMRNNMLVMMTDLCFRFPNVFNKFNDTFIQKVRDENNGVRYTSLLMCTHLLLKDQLKVSACVADIAYSLKRDANPPQIVTVATGLFCELSKKHNALYNNVPAIIDRLLTNEEALEPDGEAQVEEILQFLLQLVDNDQQKREKLVDKLVERHGDRLAGWRCVAQVLKAKEAAAEREQQQQIQLQQQQQQQQVAAQKAGSSRAGGSRGRPPGKTPKRC
ncbi:hypothetical protein niasHT_035377 [Heterodera trifolii]|uniref:Condensin complex subunit 1 C-terminal domain-containing protein n=1 Tax=Heterodera trifolii TaxID=157864 RepID=A0ABD2I1G7_9BILA